MPDEIPGLRAKLSSLSEYVREIKLNFTRFYNKRHHRKGFFWGGRFKSTIVEDGETLINCLAYIDLNPVRAGIIEKPEDYRWNSIGYHLQTDNKDDFLSTDFGLEAFGMSDASDRLEEKGWDRYIMHVPFLFLRVLDFCRGLRLQSSYQLNNLNAILRVISMTYVKPTFDIFIKYLFGKEEHKSLLIDFINAVQVQMNFPLIEKVELKNPFNIKHLVFDKESILDIKAVSETKEIYNIEVQTSGDKIFKNRIHRTFI